MMNASQPSWKQPILDTFSVVSRWLLGALFIYMGLSKALHPEEFLKLVRQYEMVNNPILLTSIAAALPWFEIFCGLLLVAGIAVRGSALMLLVMLIPFSIIVLKHALDLASAQGLPLCAIKFDCGCGTGEVFACHKLAQNCALIFLSGWLWMGSGRKFCLRFTLIQSAQH